MNGKLTAVFGASGFIGRSVTATLAKNNIPIRAVTRFKSGVQVSNIENIELGESFTFNKEHFEGITSAIYCSGIAHDNLAISSEQDVLRVNMQSPIKAMELAIQAKINRFIFISSINVLSTDNMLINSNSLQLNTAIKSKIEVELKLKRLALNSDIELLIIRCPMIYGESCPGNFPKLVKLIDSGLPLPLKSAKNKRSILFIDNLSEFILYWLNSDDVTSGEVNLTDADNIGLSDLLELIYMTKGSKSRLFSFPTSLLTALLTVLGKKNLATSLLSESIAIPTDYQKKLSWVPRFSSEYAIKRTLCVQSNEK